MKTKKCCKQIIKRRGSIQKWKVIISTVDINNDKGKLVKKTETSRG